MKKIFEIARDIAIILGVAYGTIWSMWVITLLFYADSQYDSTGAFLPWWRDLNIDNPVFMALGFCCFIFFAWQSLRFRRSKG